MNVYCKFLYDNSLDLYYKINSGRKINQNKEFLQKEKQSKITDEELKKPLFDELKIKKKGKKLHLTYSCSNWRRLKSINIYAY